MREVFGERDLAQTSGARAIKPTEVGGGRQGRNFRIPLLTKGILKQQPLPVWGRVWGYPKQGGFHQRRFELYSKDTTIQKPGNAS